MKKMKDRLQGRWFLLLLLCLLWGGNMTANAEKKAWVKYDDSAKTLTFYYSDRTEEMASGEYPLSSEDKPKWSSITANISKVVFDESFAEARPNTCSKWFYGGTNIKSIEGIQYLNTSEVTEMGFMFMSCEGLTELNLSSFNTSKVMDMGYMFMNCSALTKLNLSSFNTSKVTDMRYMFYCCEALTELNLSSFNTSKVTDMSNMFENCEALTELNLSSFNTSKVTEMFSMFTNCKALTGLDLSSFNTSEVTDMTVMFAGCEALTELNLYNFDTSKVTSMFGMFGFCIGLTELDLSSFDTSTVETMQYMFASSSNLKSLYIGENFKKAAQNENMLTSEMSTVIYSLPSNYATNKADFSGITVKPYVPINAKSEYGTICVPLVSKLTADSYTGFDKIYTVKAADTAKGTVTLAEATSIEPGVAYIYHRALASDATKSVITFEADDNATATDPATDGNLLKGTFERITAPGGSYILQTDGNFHPVASDNTTLSVGAYRAYLDLGQNLQAQSLRFVFGDATAINNANSDKAKQPKVYFDLSGRKVKNLQRGSIYINNGRKIVF